jgi:hypothetical protein
VYNVYLYLLFKKSNCQTLNFVLVYIPLNPLYCINSLSPNFGVFEQLHKEKHINSTRKRVQSATQRIFRRKNRHNYLKIQRNCVKYIFRSLSEKPPFWNWTEYVTGALYPWSLELCACVQVYGLINEKCTTSMAWAGYYVHKYEVVTIVCKSWNRGESMAFWLNRCTLSLRWANANSISRRRKQKTEKEGFKTLGLQASVIS